MMLFALIVIIGAIIMTFSNEFSVMIKSIWHKKWLRHSILLVLMTDIFLFYNNWVRLFLEYLIVLWHYVLKYSLHYVGKRPGEEALMQWILAVVFPTLPWLLASAFFYVIKRKKLPGLPYYIVISWLVLMVALLSA